MAFLCSPNNPTGVVDDEATVTATLEVVAEVDGLLVVDEAYAQFSPWSALGLVADDVGLVVTRTFSKTWSMAAARLGYLVGPAQVVTELEKVVLPYHLDALKQLAGCLAVGHVPEMDARVARLVEERGRLVSRLTDLGGGGVGRRAPTSSSFRPLAVDGAAVWQGLVDRSVLVAQLLVLASPGRLPARHHRHPRRRRCLPRRPWRRSCREHRP